MSWSIRTRDLGKRYRIGRQMASYDTLREAIHRRFGQREQAPRSHFWALRHVDLEIEQGTAVGVIGTNGAGKSTLLKILSRITEPTEGVGELRGRVGSLLEVGTGFHPELTGRENVLLAGAILGMSRSEIAARTDEIIDFSGISEFIDTPVKRYSSGMSVRLGFAVAAHLDTEILLVDEVLAVGDAKFRQKCLGQMSQIASQGRTIVLVSHNMAQIQALCEYGLWVESGEVVYQGSIDEVVKRYLASALSGGGRTELLDVERNRQYKPVFSKVLVNGNAIGTPLHVAPGESVTLRFFLQIPERATGCSVSLYLDNDLGIRIWGANTRWQHNLIELGPGNHEVSCDIDSLPIIPGRYSITLGFFANRRAYDLLERVGFLEVQSRDYFGTGELPQRNQGFYLTDAEWTFHS